MAEPHLLATHLPEKLVVNPRTVENDFLDTLPPLGFLFLSTSPYTSSARWRLKCGESRITDRLFIDIQKRQDIGMIKINSGLGKEG